MYNESDLFKPLILLQREINMRKKSSSCHIAIIPGKDFDLQHRKLSDAVEYLLGCGARTVEVILYPPQKDQGITIQGATNHEKAEKLKKQISLLEKAKKKKV